MNPPPPDPLWRSDVKPLRGDPTSHKAMILLGPWLLPSTCIFAANFLFNCIVV